MSENFENRIFKQPESDRGLYQKKCFDGAVLWRSRGYIPHLNQIGLLQSITFRLADTFPKHIAEKIKVELKLIPVTKQKAKYRRNIEKYLDSGKGCCALRNPKMAQIMQNALLKFDGVKYRILAWCIMPNHVHVLIKPEMLVSDIVQSWKAYTGRWALKHNRELSLGIKENRFWMREYWDRYIRNEQHLCDVISYIHNNPVKAGLCKKPEKWNWSSASYCIENIRF